MGATAKIRVMFKPKGGLWWVIATLISSALAWLGSTYVSTSSDVVEVDAHVKIRRNESRTREIVPRDGPQSISLELE